MDPIRVLIVDDSAVLRRELSEVLSGDPEIAIAGTAGNGHLALFRIPELKPDLVTLEVEMPGMGGLETLVEIRKLYPRLPVIMFSTLTGPGAAATVEALARGASDYATKPSLTAGVEGPHERIRQELVPKIKALCAAREPFHLRGLSSAIFTPVPPPTRVDVVVIASSTGGPNALVEVVPQLPADFPVPILIVQHMPAMFTQLLARRLDALSRLMVREGRDAQTLGKGHVWIAPGDYHMTLTRNGQDCFLGLNRDAHENSCRPAADVLFRSAAHAFGENVLAVVLTGMGSDGTRGAAAIRKAGGSVVVQDEASAVVWGMPGSIVAAGLADRICPLSGLGSEILRRVLFRRKLAAMVGA